MINVLQDLVEGLAQELSRSVAVDDPGLRLLASSTHFEDVDEARLGSLVGRRVTGPARDYAFQEGVDGWKRPERLKANPSVGLDRDRWCIPLRSRYELLGYMWLVDDGTVTTAEVTLASQTARRIEELLTRKTEAQESTDVEVEALVLGLMAPDPAGRAQAATDLLNLGQFPKVVHYSVLVLDVAPGDQEIDPETQARTIRRGLAQAMGGRLRQSFVYAVRSEGAVVVLGHRAPTVQSQTAALATALHAELERASAGGALTCTVGIGDAVEALQDVVESFQQASVAALVARDRAQSVAAWSQHPLSSLLRSWVRPDLPASLVPTAIARLQDAPEELRHVIETYLDFAGNVAAAAEHLHLHRTTVYYRLNRLRETTGLDIDDGDTRLLLHLWFKARGFTARRR